MIFDGHKIMMYAPTREKGPAVADIIGFGGAAFGGKTYGLLCLVRVAAELWPGIQIAFFRRTYPELDGPGAAIQTAYEVFEGVAKDSDGGKVWAWENGTRFFFRHCQNEKDVHKYQSQQVDILIIDEATHFTWRIVDYLLTRNRKTRDHSGFKPFAVLTSNPGNMGHMWYSNLFDVNKEHGAHGQIKKVMTQNDTYEYTYFIPAFLEDNQIGVVRDPEYENRLMKRDPEIARALRYGDWSIFAGQAFPRWTKERIAVAHFDIHPTWPKWRAVDYGFTHPCAAGWFTMNLDNKRIYVYRAFKESGLTDKRQARKINQLTLPDENIPFTYASPDMWGKKNVDNKVTTAADQYKDEKIILYRADDHRINGKRKLDRLLADLPDGKPGLQVFDEYFRVFDSMPTLVRNERNPEDVLKVDGDDDYDMLRYGLTNTDPLPVEDTQEEEWQDWDKGLKHV